MIVVCPKCGAKNRIPELSDAGKVYRCGECQTRLDYPLEALDTLDSTRPFLQHATATVRKSPVAIKVSLFRVLPFLHPLLFAMAPVLALYAHNAAEVAPSEVLIPLAAAFGFGLITLMTFALLIGLIIRTQASWKLGDTSHISNLRKGAIVASLFLVLLFSYGHFLTFIGGWDNITRTYLYGGVWSMYLFVWFALFVVGSFLIIRTRRALHKLTIVLNVVAAVLVTAATVNIVLHEVGSAGHDIEMSDKPETIVLNPVEADALPDIYYIMLDEYGSASTFNEVYGFDNSEFINYLTNKGFYVASESVANYPWTTQSLISSLNMDFIHAEAAVGLLTGNIRDYKVWRLLKSIGYQFIHVGSWYEPTRENAFADLNFNYYAMPEFSGLLFQTTWVYPFCVLFDIVDGWREVQYKRVLYKFNKLAEIPNMKEPTFVFAHMLIPHPPFVFDSEGNFVTAEQRQRYQKDLKTQYLEQLIATNNMLMSLVDKLLSNSEVAPIIIIQADEGMSPGVTQKDPSWSIEKASVEELREIMRILNAYYLPNIEQDALYPSISPVNSFRLVFNLYFDTDFELLADRSYIRCSSNASGFCDVTDKVDYYEE